MSYRTCLSGKMHFVGPDQMHGFEERVTTDIYPSDYAWTPDWERTEERIDKWYHNMATVKEAGIGAATFQIDYDEEVHVGRAATEVVLRKLLGRTAEKFVQVLELLALGIAVTTIAEVARRNVVLEHRDANEHA